jgi:phage tail-like protein
MRSERRTREVCAVDSFHIEIDGISRGGFVYCSGLEVTAGVLEYPEGGFGGMRRFREPLACSSIILERGVAWGRELYEWFLSGGRRDGAVVLLSRAGSELRRWRFRRGWPCRWAGPVLDATRSAVALESIEIIHEGLLCLERES